MSVTNYVENLVIHKSPKSTGVEASVAWTFRDATTPRLDANLQALMQADVWKFIKDFRLIISQGRSDVFPSIEAQSILDLSLNSDVDETNRLSALKVVESYISAATGLAIGEAKLTDLDQRHFLKKIHDEWLCAHNLWRLYRILPCRSFAGTLPVLTPELIHSSRYRQLEILYSSADHETQITRMSVTLKADIPYVQHLESLLNDSITCPLADITSLRVIGMEGIRSAEINEKVQESRQISLTSLLQRINESNTMQDSFSSLPSPVQILREEIFLPTKSIRVQGIWQYTLRNKGDNLEQYNFTDWFSPSVIEPNVGEVNYWSRDERPLTTMTSMRAKTSSQWIRLSASVSIEPHDEMVIRLPFLKNVPQWNDYSFLYQGGFSSPGPAIYRHDSVAENAEFSQWTLLPLVDISAFFNVVAVCSLGFLLVYNRLVKLRRG